MNRPTIEALRALLAFADLGGVKKAADRLHRSQPVVTKKLSVFKKQDACGAVLLRTKPNTVRELELTEAGFAVLPAIRQLLRQYDQVFDYLAGTSDAPNVVRIATGSSAAQQFLPATLAALRHSLDDVQFEVSVVRGSQRILDTVDGHYDLAIVSHSPSQIRELVTEQRGTRHIPVIDKLCSQSLCVVASKRTVVGRQLAELSEDRAVPVKCLTQWELVGLDRSSGIRRQLEDHMESSAGLYFVVEGGGWPAVKQFAEQGIGVGILPAATLAPSDSKRLIIRRLSDDFAINYYLIHRKGRDLRRIDVIKRAIIDSATPQST